jgi:chromosome segregation ATPase
LKDASKDGKRNVIVQRNINVRNGSDFFIDGRAATATQVKALCARLNIQVNNLCVVLAQDRVCKFASLSPSELLCETERAVNPRLFELHTELRALRKNEREGFREVAILDERVRTLDAERMSRLCVLCFFVVLSLQVVSSIPPCYHWTSACAS